jgi:hypothetical protein
MHRERQPIWSACSVVVLGLCACNQGTKPGALVGSYAIHGVLVENTCGQTALPTANPLDFVVELRTDSGVAYWMPDKATPASGTLTESGTFRFSMSETQLVGPAPGMRQDEPSDFLSTEPDFDLRRQQARACALTRKQTVSGKVARRVEDGVVNETPRSDSGAASDESESADVDLSAEHLIQVTPSPGSSCEGALAALGGAFIALPCEARYVLNGSLDTTGAVFPSDGGEADGSP